MFEVKRDIREASRDSGPILLHTKNARGSAHGDPSLGGSARFFLLPGSSYEHFCMKNFVWPEENTKGPRVERACAWAGWALANAFSSSMCPYASCCFR